MTRLSRRGFNLMLAGAAAGLTLPAAARPLSDTRIALVPFRTAPFPYHGKMPNSDVDFLDVDRNGRMGHTSQRGGVYWEDQTYSDNRVLLAAPAGFDPTKRFAIVVYFHGNGGQLERDVLNRQAVVDQIEASKLNAVLVAPQFAVDALDSSAGNFWTPGAFSAFMAEAAQRLTTLVGGDSHAERAFAVSTILLTAYSGGYDPAAFVLDNGDESRRIRGVILLDALFGENDKFDGWIEAHIRNSFFASGYTEASSDLNQSLKAELRSQSIPLLDALPKRIGTETCCFIRTPDGTDHNDFVTDAWVHWPLADVLSRIT